MSWEIKSPSAGSTNGQSGSNGIDGRSAYELAVEDGFVGTLQQWLNSLNGADGQDGEDGADGRSAYEVAVADGFSGTLQEWLDSLRGADGQDGQPGPSGSPADKSTIMGVVVHGSNAALERPTGYPSVTWIGMAAPENALNNDVWIDTTAV